LIRADGSCVPGSQELDNGGKCGRPDTLGELLYRTLHQRVKAGELEFFTLQLDDERRAWIQTVSHENFQHGVDGLDYCCVHLVPEKGTSFANFSPELHCPKDRFSIICSKKKNTLWIPKTLKNDFKKEWDATVLDLALMVGKSKGDRGWGREISIDEVIFPWGNTPPTLTENMFYCGKENCGPTGTQCPACVLYQSSQERAKIYKEAADLHAKKEAEEHRIWEEKDAKERAQKMAERKRIEEERAKRKQQIEDAKNDPQFKDDKDETCRLQ